MKIYLTILLLIQYVYNTVTYPQDPPVTPPASTLEATAARDCELPCTQCQHTMQIQGANETHFFFLKTDVSAILGKNETEWGEGIFYIRYHSVTIGDWNDDQASRVDTKDNDLIVIFHNYHNETYDGLYGCAEFNATNPIGVRERYFEKDHYFQFKQYQKCSLCHGVTPDVNRNTAADGCECKTGFSEFKNDPTDTSEDPSCQQKCSNACAPTKCDLADSNKCTECVDSTFFMPECTTPKHGFIQKETSPGVFEYISCDIKCDGCSNIGSNCTACSGLNRTLENQCNCPNGMHDNDGYYQDCVFCSDYCSTCSQDKKCTTCKEGFNRALNPMTGLCDCILGFEEENEGDLECKKCYMLADECVFTCPQHTYQNEETQVCESYEYDLMSNKVLIIYIAALLALMQILICVCLKTKLKTQYNRLYMEYMNQQMEKKSSSKKDDDGASSIISKVKTQTLENMSNDGISPLKNRRTIRHQFSIDSNIETSNNLIITAKKSQKEININGGTGDNDINDNDIVDLEADSKQSQNNININGQNNDISIQHPTGRPLNDQSSGDNKSLSNTTKRKRKSRVSKLQSQVSINNQFSMQE